MQVNLIRAEKVGLQHRELLSGKFAALNTCLSEYCFANIYLFRSIHAYEVVFAHKIFIRGKTRDGVTFFMPTELVKTADFYELQKQIESLVVFFPIQNNWLDQFPEKAFNRKFCSADSDYLFSLNSMLTYPGRHLSGQRNFVRQFKDHYQVDVEPLNSKTASDAIKFLEEWEQNKQKTDDYESCREALQLHDKLGLEGLVFYDQGKTIAFIIGGPLSKHTYIFQFIRCNTEYKGIYAYVYQHFAQSIPADYQYINLEQDLVIAGLRKAKQSYHPDKLASKWRIRSISNPAKDEC